MEYEAVIGLEVHVQLKTKSKMFTRAPYVYGAEPNTLTDPVVLGLPGTLPVMNLDAIQKTVQIGMVFGCTIAEICKWDRKHYFYPDMPKNYQISQQDQPLCLGGSVEIELPGSSRNIMGEHRRVKLNRIHLEEDVGKLTHGNNETLVDYNRAGTPLIEIVTEPDMNSADEVFAFLKSLRTHLLYVGVSDCDMEKGQMRCDANVSVRPKGATKLGTKVELKNLNSISGVRNGVAYEIERQVAAIKNGETIYQETRRWNANEGRSTLMRRKEGTNDYRFFPDPDLMPVRISASTQANILQSLPELPFAKQERFMQAYDLPYTITSVLCPDKILSDYFEACVTLHPNSKAIANLIVNDLLRDLGNEPLTSCKVTPQHIAELVKEVDEGRISKQTAQEVFSKMFATGERPCDIIARDGLRQSDNHEELESICQKAIVDNPKAVAEYKSGKLNAINAIKGNVMKATSGKANPKLIDAIIQKYLS